MRNIYILCVVIVIVLALPGCSGEISAQYVSAVTGVVMPAPAAQGFVHDSYEPVIEPSEEPSPQPEPLIDPVYEPETAADVIAEPDDEPEVSPESSPEPESEPPPEPDLSPSPAQELPETVYWVANGTVYHSTSACTSLARSRNISSGTIEQSGKARGCRNCF
jgi:hypothetical protein